MTGWRRLAAALVAACALTAAAPAAAAPSNARSQAVAELQRLSAEEREQVARLLALEDALAATRASLADLARRQAAAAEALAAARRAAAVAAAAEAQHRGRYHRRLRALYEAGGRSHLEWLLGSGSFSEFLLRIEWLRTIAAADAALVRELRAAVAARQAAAAQADQAAAEVAALAREQAVREQELAAATAEQQRLLAEVRLRQGSFHVYVALLDAQVARQARPAVNRVAAAIREAAPRLGSLRVARTDWTLVPPGVTVTVTAAALTRAMFARDGLWGVTWSVTPDGAAAQGEVDGLEVVLRGRIEPAGPQQIQFTPAELTVDGVPLAPPPPVTVDLAPHLHGARVAGVTHAEGALVVRVQR